MRSQVRMHGTTVCDRACTCRRSATDILRTAGVALDELPTSVQARRFARASEQNDLTNGAYSLTDIDGVYSENPPSGLAESNARHSALLASVNKRNSDFWAKR